MKNTKKYAIRCSTEEQARECKEKGIKWFRAKLSMADRYEKQGYTIITYEDAKEKGLLDSKEEVKQESKIEELDLAALKIPARCNTLGSTTGFLIDHMEAKMNQIIRHINKG